MADELLTKQEALARDLLHLAERVFPVKAGAIGLRFIRDNFRQGGFVNGGLQPWQTTRRQAAGGKSAASKYSPLMSSRKYLYSGNNYAVGVGKTTLYNDVSYASVHNYGGVTHPRVTPKMRRFAWAKYYEEAGIPRKVSNGKDADKKGKAAKAKPAPVSERADMWRRMALTRKTTLNVRIPRRQFMGDSAELKDSINKMIRDEVAKLLKNGTTLP